MTTGDYCFTIPDNLANDLFISNPLKTNNHQSGQMGLDWKNLKCLQCQCLLKYQFNVGGKTDLRTPNKHPRGGDECCELSLNDDVT